MCVTFTASGQQCRCLFITLKCYFNADANVDRGARSGIKKNKGEKEEFGCISEVYLTSALCRAPNVAVQSDSGS